MNLETWRQLWRVLEISDIILLIVDIRFPVLHFSPAFYHYCTNILKKDVILVLNKIDLVPTPVVVAWKHYFLKKFPNLHILLFSSAKQIKHRRHKAKKEDLDEYDEEELVVKALSADIYTAKAHAQLYECVKDIVKNNVDLTSWSHLVEKQLQHKNNNSAEGSEKMMENLTLTNEDTNIMDKLFNNEVQRKKYEHGFVTIGCCGFPNVGKSSLLNSLNGRKVVSVSRTPGHTKHLQTIFLTKSVRICDCPGLVFPSLVSKPLQVMGVLFYFYFVGCCIFFNNLRY
jgi:ribosome biogenesis GTPase A